MSVDIEYLCMTTDPCQVVDTCRGVLHANRQYVFDRCPIWFETDTRIGVELETERIGPAPARTREDVIKGIQDSRISNERRAVDGRGGALHGNSDSMLYRCPACRETDMCSGLHLVHEASNSRAVVIQRRDK